jgi:cardiolipin synthase
MGLERLLVHAAIAASVILALVASIHAVLYKRDPRGAVSWVFVIWLLPVLGAGFYVVFGINRIQRRAKRLRRRRRKADGVESPEVCTSEELCALLGPEGRHLAPLQRVGDELLDRPLLEGNCVTPLANGEEAYPDMLRAVDGAEHHVHLLAYIFEKDEAGERFVEAFARAAARGVKVRVLMDDVGSATDVSKLEKALRAANVAVDRFLPLRIPRFRYANLRNHRKILVVDGRVGFTGGMNLRASHCVSRTEGPVEQDLHFRLEGPIVEHLQAAFVEDWEFATGEAVRGAEAFPRGGCRGGVVARGVPFDPGEESDCLRWLIVGALSCARTSVRIATPYFLPDAALVAALNVAALRGVRVDVLVPDANDNPVVDWASTAALWQVLTAGVRVWRTPPPFDHTKLLVVDGLWSFVGSANLDPRSLRLNFEFNVECYDRELAGTLERRMDAKRTKAREVTLKDVDGRPFRVKLRDGLARLFSPYL